MKKGIKYILAHLQQFIPGENTILIIQAFIIGILVGAANIVFRLTIDFVHEVIFVGGMKLLHINGGEMSIALLPLLPMFGAVLLIPLSLMFPGEVNGYGFSKFLESVNLKGGILKFRNIFLKTIGPALTIGSGGSAGVEGPIAIICGTVGSTVGRLFRVSGTRMKLLIAAGSAGGIAATFNAPIAGVMFAIEIVLLGSYELSSFAAIVISSGIATILSRSYYGANPAFAVPQYELVSAIEIPFYFVFGLIIGIMAVLYIRVFYRIRENFDLFKKIHPQLKPVLGAFIVGAFGIFLPQIMGNGYEFIGDALTGKIAFHVMILLIFFKIIATSVTLGSGGAGGVFAPAIFIGAMTGGSFGYMVHQLFPSSTAAAGAYATVGIGAFLAASTHAPLTGIFLLFEMTGDYKIIIPVMFASIIGTLVAKKLYLDSIDTVELTKKGIKIHAGREMSVMSSIKVKDIMWSNFITVNEDTSLNTLINLMIQNERFYIPVVNDSGLMTGIVSIHDIWADLFDENVKGIVKAKDIATEDVIVLNPDDNLDKAMVKFSIIDIEEIPVVEQDNPRKVIAMVSRKDVITAYTKGVLTKESR